MPHGVCADVDRTSLSDRAEAGRVLAQRLKRAIATPDLLVLALPRGGLPVGFEIAQALHADLDVSLVRKLGVPGHEELAMGAIASGGVRVLNHALIEELRIPAAAASGKTYSGLHGRRLGHWCHYACRRTRRRSPRPEENHCSGAGRVSRCLRGVSQTRGSNRLCRYRSTSGCGPFV